MKPHDPGRTEIEVALGGEGEGAMADSWRELCADVRALAPPMTPEFERRLGERIAERAARSRRETPLRRRAPLRRLAKLRLPSPSRAAPGAAAPGAFAMAVVAAAVVVGALVVVAPWRTGTGTIEAPSPPRATSSGSGAGAPTPSTRAAQGAAATGSGASSNAPAFGALATAPGRVQQRAASISLAAPPSEVQTVADGVARLAGRFGGYVQNSQVQVQQEGASRAELSLRLPRAQLSGALASLERLASVRAETQSLQDITDTYDTARRRLADAVAERLALLRALARATTEGQIASLHARLSQARDAIARARSAFQAVAQRANNAEVEVTVLGDTRAGAEGLTLHRGLHDAGTVLAAILVVALVAAALLVPLALLVIVLAAARRAWLRHQRERALDTR